MDRLTAMTAALGLATVAWADDDVNWVPAAPVAKAPVVEPAAKFGRPTMIPVIHEPEAAPAPRALPPVMREAVTGPVLPPPPLPVPTRETGTGPAVPSAPTSLPGSIDLNQPAARAPKPAFAPKGDTRTALSPRPVLTTPPMPATPKSARAPVKLPDPPRGRSPILPPPDPDRPPSPYHPVVPETTPTSPPDRPGAVLKLPVS